MQKASYSSWEANNGSIPVSYTHLTEQQAKDLIGYIDETGKQDGIWETNIFGKTVEQLVNDGIRTKISMIGEESQEKLQDTMQKIVNDSTGGMVCIII